MKRAENKTRSKFPRSIQNMITRGYHRGDHSSVTAERINQSSIASRLNLQLSTAQVAAVYAWITMRTHS